jgi:hypothetical protein
VISQELGPAETKRFLHVVGDTQGQELAGAFAVRDLDAIRRKCALTELRRASAESAIRI